MKSVLFKQNLAFAALSLFVGLGAGAVCGVFGAVLDKIVPYARANFSVNVWFMPLAGLFTAAIFRLFGDGRQGMGAIFAAANGKGRGVGLRTVAFQFAGTWSAHLLCASVGREGAAVQIGAAIGGSVGKSVPVAGADRVLLVAGMAAGFSALFMTPLAAFFFALEVTFCGKLRPQLWLPSLLASFSACFAAWLIGAAPHEGGAEMLIFEWALLPKTIALGALCGLAGLCFSLCRKLFGCFFADSVRNPFVRVAAAGVLLACLLYLAHGGRYSGLGTELIADAEGGGQVYAYDWILKILFTAATLGAGFIGGEVTTMFAAGATLGAALSGALGISPEFAAALGYAAVFGASTRTLIAPVFLGAEIFGFSMFPWLALTCLFARIFGLDQSVYGLRRSKFPPLALRAQRRRGNLREAQKLY